MSKNEFIRELRAYLSEYMTAVQVEDAAAYYEDYLNQQINGGKSQEQAVAELGDPRIIGKSVIDAQSRQDTSGRHGSDSYSSGGYARNDSGDFEGYTSGGFGTDNGKPSWSKRLKFYGIIALLILIVLVVLIVVTKVVAFFFPLIVVIVILSLIFRRGGGGQ